MFDHRARPFSPLEPRLPENRPAKINMPPPAPRKVPSGAARQQQYQQERDQMGYSTKPVHGKKAAVAMRIPVVSASKMIAQQGAGGVGIIKNSNNNTRQARRRGIQITISTSDNSSNNNKAASTVAPRRRRSSNNHSSPPVVSAYHSFAVCTSPDCEMCSGGADADNGSNDSVSRRQGSFFLHANNALPAANDDTKTGDDEDSKSKAHRRRRLIPLSCEHCRMPFIPKTAPAYPSPASSVGGSHGRDVPVQAAAGQGDVDGVGDGVVTAPSSQCSSSCESNNGEMDSASGGGGGVVLEGSLAGGSSLGSTASSLARKSPDNSKTTNKREEPFSPLSQILGDRTAHPSPASVTTSAGRGNSGGCNNSSSTSSSGYGSASRPNSAAAAAAAAAGHDDDGLFLPEESGFCSGECKVSYMLTNPAAVRRRRAAAAAQAAARAAHIEASIERSRRAAAAAEERRR